jgi:NADPH2:quinone reductase
LRAVLCKAWGEPLVVEEVPSPAVRPGTVKVRVEASGVNFADTLIVQGKYQVKPDLPFTPGIEVAGTVVEAGDGVTVAKTGDRVMGFLPFGAFAEEVVVPEDHAYVLPDSMDAVSAAAFPVAYGTAHGALEWRGRLKRGEVLLVHGAAGGVGLAAVEVGKVMGATVIATAGSPEKVAMAMEHGADYGIDYSRESIRDRVKELTGGADVVFDPVGGDAFDQSLRCINWEGRIIIVGFASGRIPQIPANILLVKNCAVLGLYWGAYSDRDPATKRTSLELLLKWQAEGKLKPHVSHVMPMERAAEALAMLTERKSTGKVVLTTGA